MTSFRISFWCLFWGTIFGFIRQADEPHFWSKLSQKVAVAQAAHFLEHLVEDTWNGWKGIPLLIISEGYALLYHLLDVRVPNSAHRHAWTETGPEIYGQNVSSRREHRTHFCISLLSSYQLSLRPSVLLAWIWQKNMKIDTILIGMLPYVHLTHVIDVRILNILRTWNKPYLSRKR